ncbi:hypothetical protein [Paraburkholderia adhaesiva]|uniref:hypothetical protein n=1 Tax=Paraburkholderia adhaesiva TaxID=2883244 RepID=UPI001F420B44|nr:hypothetical protein [Paraburkholderia adhaesiva]
MASASNARASLLMVTVDDDVGALVLDPDFEELLVLDVAAVDAEPLLDATD